MKRLVALTGIALLATAGLASADPIQRVDEPTGQFSGHYDCSYYTYDDQGTATKHTRTCEQKGYVAVYSDGVEACNGNETITEPSSGAPLQGYIWVGPSHRPTTIAGEVPGGYAGAGDNLAHDDPATKDKDESRGPCADPAPPHE